MILPSLYASELIVTVSGITADQGEIGCALFNAAPGFPMDSAKATSSWVKAKLGSVECRFANLNPGACALAVSHDRNGNRKTDTNRVGMPKEDWGVSNDVRPRFRAPRFDEAHFVIKDGEARPMTRSLLLSVLVATLHHRVQAQAPAYEPPNLKTVLFGGYSSVRI
ncbi:MAG: DUF2141 domain-containing protein [Acidobacteria bacterium]|nr:DUF2141 domain-containing protein [Acidobacteriota bacterium]